MKIILKLILARLEVLQLSQDKLNRKVQLMSVELDRVKTSVAALTTVITSAEALLGQLAGLIRTNLTDPVELGKIADEIDARKTELAASVAANTPV